MKFESVLRRLRNTQGGGMGSNAGSSSTSYTPYTPYMPYTPNPPPPVLNPSRPTVTIHVPRQEIITHRPFNVTVEFSESVNGFMQAELEVGGTSGASITAWNPDSAYKNYVATITTKNWPGTAIFNVAENVAMNEFGFGNTAAAEVTVNIPQESFNFTGLPPGTPLPTFPYPTASAIIPPRLPPGETRPDPPDYAVAVLPPDAPTPEPVLTVQAKRKLSGLEKRVARTVFGASPSFSDNVFDNTLRIQYEEELIYKDGDRPHGDHDSGKIRVSNARFPFTPAIDGDTELDDLTMAERNSPGMLQLIWTLAHEMTHWWQYHQERHKHKWTDGYREPEDRYRFNEAQLRANKFVDKEAHASAVATYAVIEWQLQNRPAGQLINITVGGQGNSRPDDEGVGSVYRYMKIRGMDFQVAGRHQTTSPPVGTWITRAEANTLLSDFSVLANEIETASPLGG